MPYAIPRQAVRCGIALAEEQDGICLTVTDSGAGIAPDDLPHIFDRFYRADSSRNRQTGGSGLGLAIARQLVAAHHGKIWAESPPSGQRQGSAFCVFLPTSRVMVVYPKETTT